MNEVQNLPAQAPVVPAQEPEVAVVSQGSEVSPAHPQFQPPQGLEGVMQSTPQLDHSPAVPHGAVEQFPKVKDVTGKGVVINFPGGIDEANVLSLSHGKATEGLPDEARVVNRQLKRAA